MSAEEIPFVSWSSGRWGFAAPEPGPISALTVLTQNTWFSAAHRARRLRGLLDALERSDADVIALQEVLPDLRDRLLEADWVREQAVLAEGVGVAVSYGVMLIARVPVTRAWELPLPSAMGRSLLAMELTTDAGTLVVATAHFESTREMGATRGAQLEAAFEALDAFDRAVLLGDFNFDPADPEEAALDPRYVDLWPALRPGEPGYTEDTTRNAMRLAAKGREKHVRYDRVLARTPGWVPRAVSLVGTEPLAPGVHLSDHFGVSATLVSSRARD
ncbi:MAG TPA: endonuclease [Myxococcales bacterium]|nr:endonuclease [Myxococcales bacterium]